MTFRYLSTGLSFVSGVFCGFIFSLTNERIYTLKTVVTQEDDTFSAVDTNLHEMPNGCYFNFFSSHLSYSKALVPNELLETITTDLPSKICTIKKLIIDQNTKLEPLNGFQAQNVLFSLIDSNMGGLSRLICGNKPTVTAHLEYNMISEIEKAKFYYLYSFLEKKEGRNVWLQSTLFDQNGNQILKANGRFVQFSPVSNNLFERFRI